MVLQYLPGDVLGIESDYVAARLELPGNYWYKAPPGPATDNVDETLHQITFLSAASNNLKRRLYCRQSTAQYLMNYPSTGQIMTATGQTILSGLLSGLLLPALLVVRMEAMLLLIMLLQRMLTIFSHCEQQLTIN